MAIIDKEDVLSADFTAVFSRTDTLGAYQREAELELAAAMGYVILSRDSATAFMDEHEAERVFLLLAHAAGVSPSILQGLVRDCAVWRTVKTPLVKELSENASPLLDEYIALFVSAVNLVAQVEPVDLPSLNAAVLFASTQSMWKTSPAPLPATFSPPTTPLRASVSGPTATASTVQVEAAGEETEAVEAPEETLEDLYAELDALVGLDRVKTEIRRQAELLRVQKLRTDAGLADTDITRHLVFTGNPGTGKQLHKDTLIPLHGGGFSTVGELTVGNLILDEKGNATRIIGKYQPMENDLFLITFDDGTTVKAGGSHLWQVRSKYQRALEYRITKGVKFNRKRVPIVTEKSWETFIAGEETVFTISELARALGVGRGFMNQTMADTPSVGLAKVGRGNRETRVFAKEDVLSKRNQLAYLRNDQRGMPTSVLSTRELREGMANGSIWSIDNSAAIQYPTKNFKIDPYTLGLWLGDGYSATPTIMGLQTDIDFYSTQIPHYHRVGPHPDAQKRYLSPMGRIALGETIYSHLGNGNEILDAFRNLGLIQPLHSGSNASLKDMPEEYLYGSREQRLALLAGLLDTDGHFSKRDQTVSFSNTNKKIVEKMRVLVASLGMKPRKIGVKTPYAVFPDGTRALGKTAYTLSFVPTEQVFRLPRKAIEVQKRLDNVENLSQQNRHKWRYIKSITPIEDAPEDYYCFQVDSPNSLFLCTESFIPTHNTTIARLVSRIYKAVHVLPQGQLVEVDKSGLVAGYLGQSEEKAAKVVQSALGGVLFIDEAYSLEGDQYGETVVDLLVKAAEDNRDNLVVILAGYTGPMESFLQMNPGLKSRFRTVIEFPDYTENELVTIFERMVEKSDYTCDEATVAELRERIRREEKNEGFGNARFVRNCFEAAIVKHAWRLRDVEAPTKDQLVTLTAEDIHDDTVSSIILPDTVSDMPSESDGEEVDRAVSI